MSKRNIRLLFDGRTILCVLATLLLAYVWLNSYYQLQAAKADALAAVRSDANNYARIIAEHTSRTIHSADQVSIFLANRYNETDVALNLREYAQNGAFLGDMVHQIAIIDAKGDLAMSNLPGQKVNLSDREHFRVHVTEDTGKIFISKPLLGRLSKKWSIQMTRRANLPDGELHGVVVVSIDPFYFTHFYEELNLGKSGLVTIAREDGTVLARRTANTSDTGQNISKGEAFRAALLKDSGDLIARSTLDGQDRLFAYRKLRDYPIVVVIGIGLAEALRPYEVRKLETIRLDFIISLLLLSFTAVAVLLYGRMLKSEKNAIATNEVKSKLLAELENRQAQLTATSDRMNAILQNAADAIITTSDTGQIESFNHAAEQIFGYSEENIINHNITDLASGFDLTHWRTNESRSFTANTGLRSDGSSFPLEITASKISLLGQDKIILIARDITARRKVERLQQEFVSTVSHELRTPLTAIRGALGLLAAGVTGQFSDPTKRMLEIASANTERLTRLINDLLDVQKLESGMLALSLEKFALPDLIAETIEANQTYAQRLGVSIVTSADIPNVMLEVDGGRFQQVMANLLSNAAKFSEKGDIVKLDVLQINAERIRIEVTDQGPGIPPEFRERVFQKFAQADGSNTKSIGGSGLGLSIAKAIVNQMHGEINFHTELGKGTCFYFELPIVSTV